MKTKLEQNGLKLITTNSQAEALENAVHDPLTYIRQQAGFDGFALAYLDFGVWLGRYRKDGTFFFDQGDMDTNYLLRLRVFNAGKEVMVWRGEDGFLGRWRRDDDSGERDHAVEACQVLFGTDSKYRRNGFATLFEQRGTELILPFDNLQVDNRKNRVCLRTRNYIGFNDLGQAGYMDCRFLGFENNGIALD